MAKKEDGTVYFDDDEQKKVDEVVKERLSRHKPDDYEELKALENELESLGFTGTAAEKRAAILKAKEEAMAQTDYSSSEENEEIDEVVDYDDVDEEKVVKALAKKFKMTPDDIEKALKRSSEDIKAKESKAKADADWNAQVKAFKGKHPDIDLNELEKDEDFIDFAKGKVGNLTQKYEDYEKYTTRIAKKTADEIRSKYQRKELASVSAGGTSRDEGEYGLTARQKDLAKKDGMSYKEYATMLKNVE